MYDLYRVTLNGSPIAGRPAPLMGAAYAAALLQHEHHDSGPGAAAREFGVQFVASSDSDVLKLAQWRAYRAAEDVAWDIDTPLDVLCYAMGLIHDAQALRSALSPAWSYLDGELVAA